MIRRADFGKNHIISKTGLKCSVCQVSLEDKRTRSAYAYDPSTETTEKYVCCTACGMRLGRALKQRVKKTVPGMEALITSWPTLVDVILPLLKPEIQAELNPATAAKMTILSNPN